MAWEFVCLRKTELAQKIADGFGQPLYEIPLVQFADGELNVSLENADYFYNKNVAIIQSTGHQVNELVLGVAFLAQELKNAKAAKILAVTPYFGYGRQEKSAISGKPGHAAIIAQLFEAAGIDELVAVELHDATIIDLFSIPVHNLSIQPTLISYIKKHQKSLANTCLIAPDKGAESRVKNIADHLGIGMLVVSKKRLAIDQTQIIDITGTCIGTIGIIIDDIIATAGTAINVANKLPNRGYKSVYGYFVHPVLAGKSIDRLAASAFDALYVGNTLPLSPTAQKQLNINQFDVSGLIIDALQKIIGA